MLNSDGSGKALVRLWNALVKLTGTALECSGEGAIDCLMRLGRVLTCLYLRFVLLSCSISRCTVYALKWPCERSQYAAWRLSRKSVYIELVGRVCSTV
jgi:hypothetical protein